MHLSKNDIPIKINVPGAVARQLPDFGVATGIIGAEYFTMSTGTDLAPLLEGLEHDACQSAHWGYMLDRRHRRHLHRRHHRTLHHRRRLPLAPRPQRPRRPRRRTDPVQPPSRTHTRHGSHRGQTRQHLNERTPTGLRPSGPHGTRRVARPPMRTRWTTAHADSLATLPLRPSAGSKTHVPNATRNGLFSLAATHSRRRVSRTCRSR